MSGPRSRAWCFTLNNYPDGFIPILQGKLDAQYARKRIIKYVFQAEVGDSGTPHLQGHIRFANQRRGDFVTRFVSAPEQQAHTEPADGSDASNWIYCTKDKGRTAGPFTQGHYDTKQGREGALTVALRCKRKRDVAEEHPEVFVKYHRGLDALYAERLRKRARTRETPVVCVLCGDPGVGKTRWIYDHFPHDDVYVYTHDKAEWWDGYEGERVVVFDDYYGELRYARMLQLLDRYPVRLPVKGGFTWLNAERIFLTSNTHPNMWYQGVPSTRALKRRIHHVYKMPHEQPDYESLKLSEARGNTCPEPLEVDGSSESMSLETN